MRVLFFILLISNLLCCVPQNEIIYPDSGEYADAISEYISLSDVISDTSGANSTTRPVFVVEASRRNLPFPNDFFTRDDSFCVIGKRINLSDINNEAIDIGLSFLGDQYLPAMNKLCGFGTYAPIIIPFAGKVDVQPYEKIRDGFDKLPVLLYSEKGEVVPIRLSFVENYLESSRRFLRYLSIRPVRPLREGTKYYYFILNTLYDSKGNSIIRDKGFSRIVNTSEGLSTDEVKMKEIVYDSLNFFKGIRSDIDVNSIVLAGRFTTANVRQIYKNEREFIHSGEIPFNLIFDVDGDGKEDIGEAKNYKGKDYSYIGGLKYIVEGRFDSPNFIDKKGRMVFKDSVTPELQWIEKLQFTLFIPDGPEPHRIAMFQHGLSGNRWDMSGIVDILLKENIAVIAIDAVTHGSRTASPEKSGFQFLNINDPIATRSNFMQTHFDHMRLVQLVKSLSDMDRLPFGPNGIKDFDVSRFFYFGNSLGGILGGVTISVEDSLELAVLNVGGGGMIDFLQSYLFQAAPSLAEMPEVPLFAVVVQHILDGIDPVVHSIYTDRSKFILLQEACEDTTVPNPTTEGLARALDLPLVKPVFEYVDFIDVVDEPHRGSGLTQFHPADHSFLFYRTGEMAAEGERGRRQIVHFCKTYLDEGYAEIKSFKNE
jgi:hypothetical protein